MTTRSRTWAAASLLLCAALASAAAGATELSVEIHEPTPQTLAPSGDDGIEVVGGASIYGGVKALDLFLVMDSSESLRKTDPDDHRTAGVVTLVRMLHPKADIQLGVVDFDRKARLLAGLTKDRDAVVAALRSLDQEGETNIAEGMRTALRGFDERGRADATRVILLFTDGKSDERAALAAMQEARAAGVAVHSLLLGEVEEGEALLRKIAQGTDGSFVAVTHPSRLRDAFLNLRTTGVDSVVLRVNGGPPVATRLLGGSFTGRVTLVHGENRIEAIARDLAGKTARTEVAVTVAGPLRILLDAPAPEGTPDADGDTALVQGVATTWNADHGPRPDHVDPGVRDVALLVNGAGPFPATLRGERFQARVPVADGDNQIVAVATSRDGRTAQDEITLQRRRPGCAELEVEARRGDQPALSLSDRAIELVFDASNSMWGRMQGEPKISVAKRILADALDWLPNDLALSLRVYGHQHAHARRHCQDSELLVPLGPDARDQIRAAIDTFKPRGQTPLAHSLQQIAGDFAGFRGERAVVLVTDGIESCDGDPAAAARALQKQGPVPVHVIGFGLGGEDENAAALRGIARASGGRFIMAGSADELREALAVSVGTPYAVRNGERVVARGTLGSETPIRLPGGEYQLRIESAPPYELPIALTAEQGLTLMLKREGRKVFHARRSEPIAYQACAVADAENASDDGMQWEELPDAATPAAPRR